MTNFEHKDIDLEQPVVSRFMEKKSLKRKGREEIVTRDEGCVEVPRDDYLTFVSIQIPKLPLKRQKLNPKFD